MDWQTHRFAEGLEEILVVEEKRSIIEDQLTSQLYNPVGCDPRSLVNSMSTAQTCCPILVN